MFFDYDDCGDIHVKSALLLLGSKEPMDSEWEDRGIEIHYLNDPIQGCFDLVAVTADRLRDAERAAQRLKNAFHLEAKACEKSEVENAFREHLKEYTENFQNCMKRDLSGWKPDIHTARVKRTENALLVRRAQYDAAVLSLEGEKLFLSRLGHENAPDYALPCPLSENGFPPNLRKWLSGFLPDMEAAIALLKGMEEWEDGFLDSGELTDAGLFAFLRRFGTHLAGTIQFVNPEWISGGHFDRCGKLYLDSEKPSFPEAIGEHQLHSVIFPGQKNGFCADFCGGAWEAADDCGADYAIPIESYGRERMAWRLLSLAMARVLDIPAVSWKAVEIPVWKGEPVPAIAFSRFDLRAGKPVFRAQLGDLPPDARERAFLKLSEKDRNDLTKRIMLGYVLGFNGHDAALLDVSPEIYSSREFFDDDGGGMGRSVSLAPFSGAAAKRLDHMAWGLRAKLRDRGMDFGGMKIDGFLEVETWGCLSSPDLWRTAASFAAFSCPALGSGIAACGKVMIGVCEGLSR